MSEDSGLFRQRQDYSRARLQELSRRLRNTRQFKAVPNLCVYATGSYSRQEASQNSDIDLFFMHPGTSEVSPVSRLDEMRLFARVIEVGQQMNFPTFSNDGEYLRVLFLDDVLRTMGSPEDDSQNYFTARMLLLLESTPVVNHEFLRKMVDKIIEAYFRDYPDHIRSFRPVFLINDILRFWKTLCLNYEHRRNRPEDDPQRKLRQHVKNFKLKFSRLMTCFGTIVGVCSVPPPITQADIVAITKRTPFQRFMHATRGITKLESARGAVAEDYVWFMQHTALKTDELQGHFTTLEERAEMFRRADVFGQRVYEVLRYFAATNRYERYLVV